MPYRAGAGSGLFGSYAYPDSRPRVDIGSAIDALTNGASSLIRQAYERKRLEQQMGMERERLDLERQRAERDASNADREFGLKQQSERHRFIEAGGIPASETFDTTPSSIDISREFNPSLSPGQTGAPNSANVPSSPIARAMFPNVPTSVAPPAAPPRTPASRLKETPESYDPTQSRQYQQSIDTQALRNAGYVTRDEAKHQFDVERDANKAVQATAARAFARQTTMDAIRLRASLAKGKTGGVGRAMTANVAEKAAQNAAIGLIDRFGGSVDSAQDFLEHTDEGQAMAKAVGIRPDHLMYARSQYVKGLTGQAIRLQGGLGGLGAGESAAQVDSTRQLLGGPGQQPPRATAAPSAPNKNDVPGNINLGTPPAGGAPRMAPNIRTIDRIAPKAGAKDTSTSGDDFTDDEVVAAYNAGKRKDADIAAYIKAQRAKQKPKRP